MIAFKPALMGALMAPMMLWMAHDALMGGAVNIGWAAAAFIGAHVAVLGLVAGFGVWLARRNARVAGLLATLHRPSLSHVSAMAVGAICSGGAIHLSLHGGLI